ncbi:MAG: hypothetical protein V3T54_01320 [Acidobacteriota bacterium]
MELIEGGKKKGKSKTAEPDPGKAKSKRPQTLQIQASVKVKVDKDCGLPEAARMVLGRHAEAMLEAALRTALADGKTVKDPYMIATDTAIRITDWSILDLRPTKEETQEEIPGVDA